MITVNSTESKVKEVNNRAAILDPTGAEEAKIERISHYFKKIMLTLGLDLTDDSLKGTPDRVARMYVQEIFSGLSTRNRPAVTLFENKYRYRDMLVEKNIAVYSCCEHHFVPIIGHAHVAYFSKGKVIGLSKINRLVQYFCRRPQVQERLTEQIANALKEALETEDVAVIIEATHLCVAARGIRDVNCTTISSHFAGKFQEAAVKQQLLSAIK